MKVRGIAILMLFITINVASAQVYSIRIAFNTNLRTSNSLNAGIVETAPAGSTLNVIGEAERWLRIDRNGRSLWMANWVRYERVGGNVPTRNLPSNIDNCCFVDRQCNTDSEWTDGYWAFQNGQCAAPILSPPRTSTQPLTLPSPQPATQPSAQVDNCCFVDRQCYSHQEWTEGYWAYQNNQCGSAAPGQAPAITQPASTATDNCCYLGWSCQTDLDWLRGYRAFQNNQCGGAAPGQAPASAVATAADNCCQLGWSCQTDLDWQRGYHTYQNNQCQGESQSRASTIIPNVDLSQIDNCCHYNRQCATDLDWERGYTAYQHFRCSSDISMDIQGSSTFVQLYRSAYNLLKEISPRLYQYGITGFRRIREAPRGGRSGIRIRDRTYIQAPTEHITSFAPGTPITEAAVVEAVGGILHEACHVHLEHSPATVSWRDELSCARIELEGYQLVDPDDTHGFIAWIQNIIANIRNPEYWWWRH